MNVTIIGAGNMGRGIGTRLVAGGHKVTFVDANPETAQKAAADLKAEAATLDAPLGDVVVLAVWYGTNIEIAKQLGANSLAKWLWILPTRSTPPTMVSPPPLTLPLLKTSPKPSLLARRL